MSRIYVAELVNEYAAYLVDTYGIRHEFTNQDMQDWFSEHYPERYKDSACPQPTDYCYNLVNIKDDKNWRPNKDWHPVFEYVERGIFRPLGKNFAYNGNVFAKPRSVEEKFQVGYWENGQFYGIPY